MKAHRICPVSEISEGERKIVQIEGRSIGIFNVGGVFHALRNLCPHQFAPLCLGAVTGYNAPSAVGVFDWCKEGEIVRCPWHGWEFEIETGRSIFNPHKVRTKSYPVTVGKETDPGCDHSHEDPHVERYPVSISADCVFVHI